MEKTDAYNKYKLYMSVISGWLALVGAGYALPIDGPYNVKIIWSLIFPLLIIMAWDYEYAIITGVAGLAIFIPFYIYPDRGYGNILTTLFYFLFFIINAKMISEVDIRKSSPKIYVIQVIYGVIYVVVNSSLYLKLLALNPTGYDEPIRQVVADPVLAIQNLIFICSLIMMTAIGRVLLRLPAVRRIYKLPPTENSENNYKIFMATILCLLLFTLIDSLSNALYASSIGSHAPLFAFTTEGMVKIMMIVSAAFIACDYAMYSAMIRKEANNNLVKLNEGLEKAVAERTRELKQAYDDLESFSYTVSHEMKSPVREIETYLAIIEEDNKDRLKSESIDDISSIKRVCRDTIAMAESMMEYSKAGYAIMKNESINMNDLVWECFQELKRANIHRNIEFTITPLPDVDGDRFLLMQAITNILSNSIKFSSQKEITEISVWGWETEEEKRYYFKDNGIGFDNSYGKKLFSLFSRAHDRSRFEGNGIGLAMVKRIIERHDGQVEIQGEKNAGCQVLIRLPRSCS
ncbi:MAG TPA: ATP-binding protein [Syntrophomonas sp.]|nr:ATP-binding protein [Syntrophomonas sp.]